MDSGRRRRRWHSGCRGSASAPASRWGAEVRASTIQADPESHGHAKGTGNCRGTALEWKRPRHRDCAFTPTTSHQTRSRDLDPADGPRTPRSKHGAAATKRESTSLHAGLGADSKSPPEQKLTRESQNGTLGFEWSLGSLCICVLRECFPRVGGSGHTGGTSSHRRPISSRSMSSCSTLGGRKSEGTTTSGCTGRFSIGTGAPPTCTLAAGDAGGSRTSREFEAETCMPRPGYRYRTLA